MLSPRADLLAPFAAFDFSDAPVIVAISGGSDSTALLLLLKSFLDQRSPAPPIVAVTIDHGLRPGSAQEAHSVAALAASLGIEHRILNWHGPKPKTGLAVAARLARYGLLAQTARRIGARMVLTGHTADDQAETVAMRQSRGPGLGLSGMAPATLFDGSVWIGRPLLAIRRAALRDYLASRQVTWSEDPTNTDHTFERARVRIALRDPHRIDALLAVASEHAAARLALGERAASLIDMHARKVAPGLSHLDPTFGRAAARTETIHALRILLSVVGGVDHLVDESRADALLRKLVSQPHRATLSRVLAVSRKDGIWLCRETRGLPKPGPASDGMIWDGRYRLTAASGADEFLVRAVGTDSITAANDPTLPPIMARAAHAAEPVVFPHTSSAPQQDDRAPLDKTASAPGWHATPILAPWAAFLPSFDLAPARAAANLIGAQSPPDPPLADHIVTSP